MGKCFYFVYVLLCRYTSTGYNSIMVIHQTLFEKNEMGKPAALQSHLSCQSKTDIFLISAKKTYKRMDSFHYLYSFCVAFPLAMTLSFVLHVVLPSASGVRWVACDLAQPLSYCSATQTPTLSVMPKTAGTISCHVRLTMLVYRLKTEVTITAPVSSS